jgi:cytidylate kinase
MIVAVDGPAAAGKGTLARAIARRFGLHFLDTGLLYRMVGLAVLDAGDDPRDAAAAIRAARALDPLRYGERDLRSEAVGDAASFVAVIPDVRAALLGFQREFAGRPPGAVLDGRDIGTIVCPSAQVKIFVTASPEVRARRRVRELAEAGIGTDYATVLADIRARDERDRARVAAPLIPASDAHVLDTSAMNIEEAVNRAIEIVEAERAGRSAS